MNFIESILYQDTGSADVVKKPLKALKEKSKTDLT